MCNFVLSVQIYGQTFIYRGRDFGDVEAFGRRRGVFMISTLRGVVLSSQNGRTALVQEVVRG